MPYTNKAKFMWCEQILHMYIFLLFLPLEKAYYYSNALQYIHIVFFLFESIQVVAYRGNSIAGTVDCVFSYLHGTFTTMPIKKAFVFALARELKLCM